MLLSARRRAAFRRERKFRVAQWEKGTRTAAHLLQEIKKNFCCNGSIVNDAECGNIIQLQGDQRENIRKFLIDESLCDKVFVSLMRLFRCCVP